MDVEETHNTEPVTLKRRASPSFDAEAEAAPGPSKKLKEDLDTTPSDSSSTDVVAQTSHDCTLATELIEELQCPCCSALAHRPVVVIPCGHLLCGSCCIHWIKNGGTNCPTCRSSSSTAVPSRPLEIVIQTVIRACPNQARSATELQQADAVYKQGIIRIPPPREASPEPNIHDNTDLARPCPTCSPHNPYGWHCPTPVPDPTVVGLDNAWSLEDGNPPGHTSCGNCENLMSTSAPMNTRCDFCATQYCGIAVRGRCMAPDIRLQTPHNLESIEDLLTCEEMYDQCFNSNHVEAEIMLDYLTAQKFRVRAMYLQMIVHALESEGGMESLIDDDNFPEAPVTDAGEPVPRNRICRDCARTVFISSLGAWWIRERKKGFLEEKIAKRPDCESGNTCIRQTNADHAKEFNHIITSPPVAAAGSSSAAGPPLPMYGVDATPKEPATPVPRQPTTSTSSSSPEPPFPPGSSMIPFPFLGRLPAFLESPVSESSSAAAARDDDPEV